MTGLTVTLADIEFAQSLGLALPVPRGLSRFYLPGSSAQNDADLSPAGIAGSMEFPDAPYFYTVRQPWHLDFTTNPGDNNQRGGYRPNYSLSAPPVPPVSVIAVARNGISFGNMDTSAKSASFAVDVSTSGLFSCQAASGYGVSAPSLSLPGSYQTDFNFYAATWDYVSGGQETEKIYYGRANSVTSASASQAAQSQATLSTVPIKTPDRYSPLANTSVQRGLAALIVHTVKLTDEEVNRTYQWLRRYFDSRLPNNGL